MKKILLIVNILLTINLYCFSEITIDTVWGAWDHHYDKYIYETLLSISADGIDYLQETQDYLVFEKNWQGKYKEDWNGQSVIEDQGRIYLIENYHQNGNKFIFQVRYVYSSNGDEDTMDFVIHFIDENHMWREDIHTKKQPEGTRMYTRMPTIESLNIKEMSLNEGDFMYCNDNLRLRTRASIHASDSKVIASMKKGTKVKIIKKMGWKGYIDNVLADWAEVEVIEDSFDKDGKPLPKGTRGWCFGAYLTLLDEGSK